MVQSAIGMNRKEIRKMAYQIGEKYSVNHPWRDGIAGVDWLRSFLGQHPELVSRKAENTSLARLTGFNRESVRTFFEELSNIMSANQYSPEQIWNVDETGFSTVSTKMFNCLSEALLFFGALFTGSNKRHASFRQKGATSCGISIFGRSWNKYNSYFGNVCFWRICSSSLHFSSGTPHRVFENRSSTELSFSV